MFTGIVQAIGQIIAVDPVVVSWSSRQEVGDESHGQGRRLTIAVGNLDHQDVAIGDSIAISGACMTVVAIQDGRIQVDVSAESLRCTVGLDRCGPVNLEKAMRASDRWGGHMVSGHVDGTAEVIGLTAVGESWCIRVRVPAAFSALVTEKGSIALDGVSLTVNSVSDTAQGTEITVNIIPHTWQATTLHLRQPGDRINVELDQLAKQVERIVSRMARRP